MARDKRRFTFWGGFWETAKLMSDEDQFVFFQTICRYAFDGIEPTSEVPYPVHLAFEATRENINSSLENIENGTMGGRPKKTPVITPLKTPVITPLKTEKNTKITKTDTITNVSASRAHTREEVFSTGKDPAKYNPPIPDGWLNKFFERMTQSGWADKDGKPIRNLAATISAWWARDKEMLVEPTKPQPPKPTAPEDWTLCLERCANCNGNRCTRGIKVPPSKNPMRPMPPEDCPFFTAIAKEGAA